MDSSRKATLKTSRGFSYTYYHLPGDASKPTILMQHGFPDDAHLFQWIIPHLVPLGFPILAPDLPGSGGTDKPLDPAAFAITHVAADLIEILDHENISKVISLGHDWGSFVAQNLYWHHPDRVVGLILLNVAYAPPTKPTPFDLQQVLNYSEQKTGYPRYAYWEFFTAPDAEQVILSRLESWWCVLHGSPNDWMRNLFCQRGALRKFLENDERCPLRPYAEDAAMKEQFFARWKRDGLNSQFNWYRATIDNHQYEAAKKLDPSVFRCEKPLLFVGCDADGVCLPQYIQTPIKEGLMTDYVVKEIECAHWSPIEKPEEIARHIREFLGAKF